MPVLLSLTNLNGIAAMSASLSVVNAGQLAENEQHAPQLRQGSVVSDIAAV